MTEFKVGEVHNGYLLKENLEFKYLGDIFMVEKPPSTEKLVLKILKVGKPGTIEFENITKSVSADVGIGIKLATQCKFLVMLKEFFIENEYCCLVMEYCSRGSLQKRFEKKEPLSESEVITLISHILNGIKMFHASNFIYSDLSPSHILISGDGTYKLAQGSVFRVLRSSRELKVGTQQYTAPEILKAENFSYPSDVFMFGLILYEAMTGHHPFEKSKGKIDVSRLINSDYKKIESDKYNPELIDLCHAMLSVKPEDRPTVPQILRKPIIPRVDTLRAELTGVKRENRELKRRITELEEENRGFKIKLGIPVEEKEDKNKNKVLQPSSSSENKKYNDAPLDYEEKVTFIKNTADHGVVGKGTHLEFTKEDFFSYFVNKKLLEGIWRVEIKGTLTELEENEFVIGVVSKEVLPTIFASHLNEHKGACCLEASLDQTNLWTGTVANEYLTIPVEGTTTFIMEINLLTGMLYFFVKDQLLELRVTNVPRAVYFGMSGRVGAKYEVRSLRRIPAPTVKSDIPYESYKWVEDD